MSPAEREAVVRNLTNKTYIDGMTTLVPMLPKPTVWFWIRYWLYGRWLWR